MHLTKEIVDMIQEGSMCVAVLMAFIIFARYTHRQCHPASPTSNQSKIVYIATFVVYYTSLALFVYSHILMRTLH